ncbi:MAG: MBOAT family protein, partial [Oscillospiraceae bacterium]|nr:MBOAT family protein [Oscillospiraceae bacterium]
FLTSGLWHGAGWTYVLWGFLHGMYQAAGRLTLPARKRLRQILGLREEQFAVRLTAWAVTFFLVALAFLPFRANSMSDTRTLLHALFFDFRPAALLGDGILRLGLDGPELAVGLIALLVLILSDLLQERFPVGQILERQMFLIRWPLYLLLIFSILIFGIYGPGYDAAAFIYFAF